MANSETNIVKLDQKIIDFTKHWAVPFSRFAIFLVYFWFGILKVLSLSPANPLVADLLSHTLPFISFDTFIILFGVFEMIVGVVFIVPRLERLAILLLGIHLVTTVMPLFVLPAVTWQNFLVPTLEGQYIIKNVLIISVAIGLASHLHVMKKFKQN